MKKYLSLELILVLTAAVVTGCSSKTTVYEKRPVVEVSAEAQTMTPDQLQKTVAQYQSVLESKKNEFVAMQNKIKEIPLTQMMGEEAKKIKDELTTIASSVSALTERMNVYVAELSKK